MGGLVDLVEIGPFFAVDLDVDEMLVHHPGGLGILEGFMGHDVAPVAGGVADGEQNRFVFPASPLQGFLAPRIPVHGVVGVLLKVRARLVDQGVFVHGRRRAVGREGDQYSRRPCARNTRRARGIAEAHLNLQLRKL